MNQPEPTDFIFDVTARAAIAQSVARYPAGRQASAVVPLLDIAQRQMARLTGSAWLPRAAIAAVAVELGMAPVRVYEVATFYSMFNGKPVGKYFLQVCTSTPCWLRGSDDVVAACQKISGIAGFGGSSADGMFTLTEVECLGACVNAPMLQINDDYYEDLDTARTEALLTALKSGAAPPPPGPTDGRHGSEPVGGQTVLLNTLNLA